MYAGKVVETGTKWEIFKNPQHPYTKGLLRSVPRLDQKKDEPLVPIFGTPPDLIKPPAGCGFCARCDDAMNVCATKDSVMTQLSDTHFVSCWLQHPVAQEVAAR
jgi:oligopeptide transport system ATP-binding protein